MNFVEQLNLFGVIAKEIPCIKGSGAPTTTTEGAVGCLYMDTDTGAVYKCVSEGVWEKFGGGTAEGTVLYTEQTLSDEQKTQVRNNIGAADGAFFEIKHGNNILPPDAESGYYDPSSAMTPMESDKHERTPKSIPVVGYKYIYVYTNGFTDDTTMMVCAIFMDANGVFIGSRVYRSSLAYNALDVPSNAASMHLWVTNSSTPSIHISDVCISRYPLEGYEAYSVQAQLREDALPKQSVWADAVDNVVGGFVKWDGTITANSSYKTAHATVEPDKRYRITAWNNTGVKTVVVFFDENGNRIDANFEVGEANGGVFHDIDGISWYEYDGVEIDVPGTACTMLVTSGTAYCDPLVEQTVTMQDLADEVELLSNQVENTTQLKGKTIVNFGDSIFGNFRPPEDISTELARLTGATVYNCGFGGCRMGKHSLTNYDAFGMAKIATAITSSDFSVQDAAIADTEASESLPSYFADTLALLKTIDFNDVDVITIAYGTNDFMGGVAIDIEQNTDSFGGALRYTIETILAAFPHIRIFACGQTYRFWMDESGVFTEDSDIKTRSDGKKLTDFVVKTEEIAKAYHLPFINNYDIGMNKFNRSQYFTATDGTHPNINGRHLIATHMAKELF